MIGPDSPPAERHRIWLAAWWTAAQAVSVAGHDCTVLDPDAQEDEVFHDGDPNHGVIHVRTHAGLGWTLLVTECEPDVEDDS